MASKKFKSNTGYPVHIFRPDSPHVIHVPADGTLETADKAELQALKDSPEVDEVKGERKKGS